MSNRAALAIVGLITVVCLVATLQDSRAEPCEATRPHQRDAPLQPSVRHNHKPYKLSFVGLGEACDSGHSFTWREP